MIITPRLSMVAAATTLCVLAAGCATQLRTGSDNAAATPAPAAGAAATSAAAAPAAAAAPRAPQGMRYAELKALIGTGTGKNVKQDIVGKTVTLDLDKAAGRGAPAGHYSAADDDATYFRCRSTARGFSGGEVTASVADYRYQARGRQKIVELDRCATETAAAVAAEPARSAAAAAPQPAPAAAATAGTAASSAGAKPGMDARGNIIDSSKVEAGSGRKVKGLNDYEGEITGNPAPNSKFAKLQIGMPVRQVTDIAGPPTDQGGYMTGKAWIPFYFGGDRHRFEMTYKGQGRLIFAGGGMGDFSSGYLIWIMHNPNEPGYR